MRLISIQAKGFKSFADKTNITFPSGITGIVGPNGCGKSNISDAIKWVFGEQSAKSLRGKSMEDIIFAGSQDRKATNYAEVNLVFDNSDRKLNLDFNQIEITRRLYRGEGSNEYYINKELVRLKDIHELIMDTGLGKGSLALISQGTVSSFAESKPEDRRAIFEEAANVSKYKKRKIESVRKLDRTQINLERISDIVHELEKQYIPLEKQAEKAQKYLKIKNELQNKEVTLFVYDISQIQTQAEECKKIISAKTNELENLEFNLSAKENSAKQKKDLLYSLEHKVNKLQSELIELSDKTSQVEKLEQIISYQKNEILTSTDKESRTKQLEQSIPTFSEEIKVNRLELLKTNSEVKEINSQYQNNKSLALNNKELVRENEQRFNKLIIKKEVTMNNLRKNAHLPFGVKSIMDAKNNFPGVIGLVQNEIAPKEGYELAIASAIGKQKDSIITKTTEISKKAIAFLKENKAGRATILPLDNISGKSIADEAEIAAQTIAGYIGKAINYVNFNDQNEIAAKFILGNILLTEDIKAAIEVSKVTKKRFRVTTLDGQVVNFGGSISGGHVSAMKNTSNLEKLLKLIEENIIDNQKQKNELDRILSKVELKIEKEEIDLRNKKNKHQKLNEIVEIQESKLTLWMQEYKELTGKEYIFTSHENNDLIKKYKNFSNKLSFIKDEIRTINEKRENLLNEWKELDEWVTDKKKEIRGIENIIHNNDLEISKGEVRLQNFLQTLNVDYQLTYEFAKEKYNDFNNLELNREIVFELRNEIQKLGYVNIDSIAQLAEIKDRYHTMKEQLEELTDARKTIINVIGEMDSKMLKTFDLTFQEINMHFQNTFSKLFNGGTAKLEYTDPTNILESGIEVKVSPPGKSITNLNLFSGGEKSLIALAVLFAILKTKPIPLCVLDEVEAPLDQVNVERFAQYLQDFTVNTQFIVITHRPGTMQKCDSLYGITMQEQGVSKLVSVDMTEAKELSEHN